jgi:hypothetical protein
MIRDCHAMYRIDCLPAGLRQRLVVLVGKARGDFELSRMLLMWMLYNFDAAASTIAREVYGIMIPALLPSAEPLFWQTTTPCNRRRWWTDHSSSSTDDYCACVKTLLVAILHNIDCLVASEHGGCAALLELLCLQGELVPVLKTHASALVWASQRPWWYSPTLDDFTGSFVTPTAHMVQRSVAWYFGRYDAEAKAPLHQHDNSWHEQRSWEAGRRARKVDAERCLHAVFDASALPLPVSWVVVGYVFGIV